MFCVYFYNELLFAVIYERIFKDLRLIYGISLILFITARIIIGYNANN